jgi:hypothetical protein
MFDAFHIKPLSVNSFTGELDQRSRGIVASTIVLRLFDMWPGEMVAILADWPEISETARAFALPLLQAMEGSGHE